MSAGGGVRWGVWENGRGEGVGDEEFDGSVNLSFGLTKAPSAFWLKLRMSYSREQSSPRRPERVLRAGDGHQGR